MSDLEISVDLLEALQKLSALLEVEDALQETLEMVVRLSVDVLPGCESAGVTLGVEGEDATVAASDDLTLELDKIQYDAGDGPCIYALRHATVVKIPSVDGETRWPEFVSQAAERGLRSTLSLPLRENGSVGALNLYSTRDNAFDETSVQIGELFARQVSVAMHNARTYSAARKLARQLNEALESRDLIGQAKGILMERESISNQEAFEMLKGISQSANVKLRDIAQRVVDEKDEARRS